MVLKSLWLFLLYQIWDMPLCLCMSRKTNEGMMDRERDGGSESGVCIVCERPRPTRWGWSLYGTGGTTDPTGPPLIESPHNGAVRTHWTQGPGQSKASCRWLFCRTSIPGQTPSLPSTNAGWQSFGRPRGGFWNLSDMNINSTLVTLLQPFCTKKYNCKTSSKQPFLCPCSCFHKFELILTQTGTSWFFLMLTLNKVMIMRYCCYNLELLAIISFYTTFAQA